MLTANRRSIAHRMNTHDVTQSLIQTVEKLSDISTMKGLYHHHRHGDPLPSAEVLEEIIYLGRSILFPGYYGKSSVNSETLQYTLGVYVERLFSLLTEQIEAGICFDCEERSIDSQKAHAVAIEKSVAFIAQLPHLREILKSDVEAAYLGDPAAESYGEVISCYPVIKALSNYRMAHELLKLDVPLIPRIMTEMAHSETGIDIHPGAQIGHHFTIDHGTGVVIGATCIIGNYVKLYQGVTLGAKSFPLDGNGNPIKRIPRHPILCDHVIVYSNATVLGRITVGEGATVGGNIWVTEDVPPGARLVQRKNTNQR